VEGRRRTPTECHISSAVTRWRTSADGEHSSSPLQNPVRQIKSSRSELRHAVTWGWPPVEHRNPCHVVTYWLIPPSAIPTWENSKRHAANLLPLYAILLRYQMHLLLTDRELWWVDQEWLELRWGTHNRSAIVAVHWTPCAIPPPNTN
jgi:hypothetical protein